MSMENNLKVSVFSFNTSTATGVNNEKKNIFESAFLFFKVQFELVIKSSIVLINNVLCWFFFFANVIPILPT